MATSMFVRAKVNDYASWRPHYDSLGAAHRAEFGILNSSVHRDINDQNVIVVMHRFRDAASALAFINMDATKDVMQQSGVIGAPEVWIADDAA